MTTPDDPDAIRRLWDRGGLPLAVRAAVAAMYPDRSTLTVDELAPLDQFHGGGLPFTRRLASVARIDPGARVLDVGGGLGGPARTLAADFGCEVTVIDLAESYIEAGRMLTALTGLGDRVTHVAGDALNLPFSDASFDVVWTQNSGMNIAAKEAMYGGFRRVLRPGGVLAMQEPVAGRVEPRVYPLMWATGPEHDHVRTEDALRSIIEAAGLRVVTWEAVAPIRPPVGGPQPPPAYTIQRLVMGDDRIDTIMAAARVNEREDRLRMIHATAVAEP